MGHGLRSELEQVQAAIINAEKRDAELDSGLLKSLIAARLEVLRTTEALVRQRIHAIDSGAQLTFQLPATPQDPGLTNELAIKIAAEEQYLSALREDAEKYVGGLLYALKNTTIATHEQTIALLHQKMLIAKYGLAYLRVSEIQEDPQPAVDLSVTSERTRGKEKSLITVSLSDKRLLHNETLMVLDLEFKATGLPKPSRAIKGSLDLCDLFGENQLSINWTIDKALVPGGTLQSRGMGFHYNRYIAKHQWV